MASDGRWYPPPGAPTPGMGYPTPHYGLPIPQKTNRLAIWSLILVIALGALGALAGIPMAFVARRQVRQSQGTQRGAGLALAALIVGFSFIALFVLLITLAVTVNGSSTSSESGPPLSELQATVKGDLTGTGAGRFGVAGVSSVVCNPPKVWQPGNTFTCFAYDSSQSELGQLNGTIEPNSASGDYRWNAEWLPNG
jgi:hypothetical protein